MGCWLEQSRLYVQKTLHIKTHIAHISTIDHPKMYTLVATEEWEKKKKNRDGEMKFTSLRIGSCKNQRHSINVMCVVY